MGPSDFGLLRGVPLAKVRGLNGRLLRVQRDRTPGGIFFEVPPQMSSAFLMVFPYRKKGTNSKDLLAQSEEGQLLNPYGTIGCFCSPCSG